MSRSALANEIRRPSLPRLIEAVMFERGIEYLLSRVDPMWSFREPRARVARVVDEAGGYRTVVFRPNARFDGFAAGQSLTLAIEVGSVRAERAFALASAPCADGSFCVTFRREATDPVVAHFYDTVRAGDVVPLSQAWGELVMPAAARSSLVFASDEEGLVKVLALLLERAYHGGIDDAVVVMESGRAEHSPIRARLSALAAACPGLRLVEARAEAAASRGAIVEGIDKIEVFVVGQSRFVDVATRAFSTIVEPAHLHVERLDVMHREAVVSRRRRSLGSPRRWSNAATVSE